MRLRSRRHRKHLKGLAFLLPALSLYLVFVIGPLAASLWGSVFEWDGVQRSAFTGLSNFRRLFDGTNFDRVVGAFAHNGLWFAGIMLVQNVLGLLIAYVLFLRGRRYSFFQSVYFLPAMFSPVIVGALWRLLLAPRGPVEGALNGLGLHHGPLTWLGDTGVALWILIGVDIWNWIGLPILVFLAGFHAIPMDLFEAAKLDGAGPARTLGSIAMPLLIPSISILTILTFINAFNQFDIVYVMEGIQGNPAYSTDVLVTYFYRLAFGAEGAVGITDIGLALALGSLLFVFLAVFSVMTLRFFARRTVTL